MEAKTTRSNTGNTPKILYKMYNYMDNMANAVTNENAFIEQLTTNNSKQASTISTQAITIISLSDEVKKLQLKITDKGGRGGIGGKSDNSRKFLKDRYCYLHSFKVSHMRPDCNTK